jgi:hypothetical protein
MAGLSSLFPVNARKIHASKAIKPRSIIKIFSTETTPPKPKRFLILGEGDGFVGALIINSEINKSVFSEGSYLHSLQKEILYFDGCKYLDHNSFVDCSYIYQWPKDEVVSILTSDIERILGELLEPEWNAILKAVRETRLISLKTKKKYGVLIN